MQTLLILMCILFLVVIVCFLIFEDAIETQNVLMKLMRTDDMRNTYVCHSECQLSKEKRNATSNDSKDN